MTIDNFVRALAVGVAAVYVIVAIWAVSDDNVGVAVEALAIDVSVILLLLSLAAYLDARPSTD